MTRGMLGIVAATFFSDVGHEMVTAVLPLYLASVGLGPAALGLMEGVADFAFSLSKLAGGAVGHRIQKKRPLAALGYGITATCTAAIAFVASVVSIGLLRMLAWVGRGFRSPLRDFLLADEVQPSHFGRAYGVERAADMVGAVAGPLIALGLLAIGVSLPIIIAVSFGPAILSSICILAFTRDRAPVAAAPTTPQDVPAATDSPTAKKASIPRRFYLLVGGVLLFGFGDFSRTFLILLVASTLGGSTEAGALTGGVLAYTAHNLISALAAFPAGRLGDRIPKWKVLVGGYALGAATNLLLAGAHTQRWALAVAVVGSAVYIAVQETVEKAAVAEMLPREQRSLGFGILASANAIGDMASSLYVGLLLAAGLGHVAFAVAGVFGVLGTAWVWILGRRSH